MREGVQNELDRRGVGGGGGGNDRLAMLERDVAVIQSTMVTKEFLECELGKIRVEIAKMPLTLMRWGLWILGGIGGVAGTVFAIMRMTGKAP